MKNFKRKNFLEKRTHSIYKPILYFMIQIVLIWEVFWILTGKKNVSQWNYFETITAIIIIGFFIIKTVEIEQRV